MLLLLGMPYADALGDDQDRCNDPGIALGARQNLAIVGVPNIVGVPKKIMKIDVIIGHNIIGRNFGEDGVHRR